MVQGLTEFLPVSSSAHLVFFQSLFRLEESQIFFDVMLHVGTLFAVLIYFRRDVEAIGRGLLEGLRGRGWDRPETRLFLWIVVASVPTGLMGLLFKKGFESLFARPGVAGAMLLVTGVILALTRTIKGRGVGIEKLRVRKALLIGLAQGLAIIPGISRSGATLSASLFCGLERELAGRFSFLLSVPAILGATLLEFRKLQTAGALQATALGAVAAFVMGLLALKILMGVVKKGRLSAFSWYCWAMGIVMLLWSL